ncbi:DUF885 domain-containing protein [Hellea balneolensis]|uniref:DUF885 domain-containing protein n=1 Tax=Hellea balneolensis TaxID=287478 RepID=UPI0003F53FDB|nr:DUF885 domain-containing protein [Hellea balneolensis]
MRLSTLFISSALSATLLLTACSPSTSQTPTKVERVEAHSQALNDWFQARYEDELARSPMTQTYLGMKDNQDKLDDASALAVDESAALSKAWLEEMRREFDIDRLDKQTALSYRLFEFATEDALETYKFSQNEYVFQHMSGPHTSLPSFLINFHSVGSVEDAQAYIARLKDSERYLGQYADRAQAQFDQGVILPKFVYPKISEASRNVINGAPFTEGEDSPLFSDIKSKIEKLNISEDQKNRLVQDAKQALMTSLQPAYINLIAMFSEHQIQASEDDGAWKLPNAKDYYAARLRHYTTTDMTAEDIHETGLKEVARIQDEMREIMTQVGFEGDLKEFFDYLRSDPQFVFPNTDEGRERYITGATDIIEDMKTRLDSLFITKPKADIVVKRVEPFREATAFGAFYNQPAADGSRPGTYYINLKDVKEQPKYLMQALAYHEGIPGHHMQIAIAMELKGLPKFRTMGGHTSYIEGWALYSESVPKELNLYTDPYSDFGRLSMEIFRAARLVVDTGIHTKKWTREEAVQYYLNNIPNPEGDVRAEIDRYIVWPGQATAYKIGMIKIQDLRKKAEERLGDKFDIREFHDVVLANGSVPLKVLEELVEDWVTSKQD